MAAPTPFDTLDYAKKLQSLGVPAPQAELQARALAEAMSSSVASRSDVATLRSGLEGARDSLRAEIVVVRDSLRAEIRGVEARLDAKIDYVRNELKLDLGGRIDTLKWMVTFFGAVNVGILVKLLVSGP